MSAENESRGIAKVAAEFTELLTLNAELTALLRAAVRLTELNLGLNHQWLEEARAALAKARN